MDLWSLLPQGAVAALPDSAIFENGAEPTRIRLARNRLASPAIPAMMAIIGLSPRASRRVQAATLFFLILFWLIIVLVFPAAGATGGWTATASLTTARDRHTATLLGNGKVLVAGGMGLGSDPPVAELYDPSTGTWSPTGALATARDYHTATLLPDGQVLVAAGYTYSSYLNGLELYDAATEKWGTVGFLAVARYLHTATLLGNGQVLVAGGYNGSYLTSTEIYPPIALVPYLLLLD